MQHHRVRIRAFCSGRTSLIWAKTNAADPAIRIACVKALGQLRYPAAAKIVYDELAALTNPRKANAKTTSTDGDRAEMQTLLGAFHLITMSDILPDTSPGRVTGLGTIVGAGGGGNPSARQHFDRQLNKDSADAAAAKMRAVALCKTWLNTNGTKSREAWLSQKDRDYLARPVCKPAEMD